MLARSLVGLLGFAAVLLVSAAARAECTKDTDCKGDRVCEEGACVDPPASLPAAPAPPPGASPPAAGASPAAGGGAPAPAPPRAFLTPTESGHANQEPLVYDAPPPRTRHSTAMMVGGIVMVSFAPVALFVTMIASVGKGLCQGDSYSSCNDNDDIIVGGLVATAVLVGVGVPLIVIGARKEPNPDSPRHEGGVVQLSPWATPQAAGLGLRLDL